MKTTNLFNLNIVHSSWKRHVEEALSNMDPLYLEKLSHDNNWLPGAKNIFNAFSLPLNEVRFVLFGESPYPRPASANGYAFWDAAVTELWSPTGMNKVVNRATSLRNFIKMLLIAEEILEPDQISQHHIIQINKTNLVQTNNELFGNFIKNGFLLLNATLVLKESSVNKEAVAWQPFIKHILNVLFSYQPDVELILLGNIANKIDKLIVTIPIKKLYAEHPYNLSFITNSEIIQFFKPFHLLRP